MKRYVFRFLCIALLLAGQHAALTHALAHAQGRIARSVAADTQGAAGSSQKTQRFALCDYDYAYSQVLGAVHTACTPPLKLDASFETFPVSRAGRAGLTEVPFLIRGPPQLL